MRLHVCLFDRDCEEFPVTTIQVRAEQLAPSYLYYMLTRSKAVQRTLKAQGFSLGQYAQYSVQVDAREGVVRFRDVTDALDEPGNIAMMINIRLSPKMTKSCFPFGS